MKRFQNMSAYFKFLLLLLLAMAILFAPIYASTIARVGFLYRDEIFIPRQEGNAIIYEGTINGSDASFTVEGATVVFSYAGKTYAPFCITQDSSAVPTEHASNPSIVGYVITEGDALYYRGGAMKLDSGGYFLFDSEETPSHNIIVYADGIVTDADGNIIDTNKPSESTLLTLVNEPTLKHKGTWGMYVLCVVLSVFLVFTILFADELFYMRMALRVSEPELLTPSDWTIAGRYIGDTIGVIVLLVAYLQGLTVL